MLKLLSGRRHLVYSSVALVSRQQREVVLYGFSMGGMGVATVMGREDLLTMIDNQGVTITKIILDGPIANVEKILRKGSDAMGIPAFIANRTFQLLNDEYHGYPVKMTLSNLLAEVSLPVLILQGTNDYSQPIEILLEELQQLEQPSIQMAQFEGGRHVKLYQVPEHKARYDSIVSSFLNTP